MDWKIKYLLYETKIKIQEGKNSKGKNAKIWIALPLTSNSELGQNVSGGDLFKLLLFWRGRPNTLTSVD